MMNLFRIFGKPQKQVGQEGEALAVAELEMLKAFAQTDIGRFYVTGSFVKSVTGDGVEHWCYRPQKGIGGTTMGTGTLQSFIASLERNFPNSQFAPRQAMRAEAA